RTQSKMKDGSGQRCVRLSFIEHLGKMLGVACASGSDNRNAHRIRYRLGQLAIESLASSIAIHRCKQDFPRPSRLSFLRPFDRIFASRFSSAMYKSLELAVHSFGVNSHNYCL